MVDNELASRTIDRQFVGEAHLLRAPRVHNLGLVLRLVAIPPRKIHDELSRVVIVQGIDGGNMVLPGACGRSPGLGDAGRGSAGRRVSVTLGALGAIRRGVVGCCGAASLLFRRARL